MSKVIQLMRLREIAMKTFCQSVFVRRSMMYFYSKIKKKRLQSLRKEKIRHYGTPKTWKRKKQSSL